MGRNMKKLLTRPVPVAKINSLLKTPLDPWIRNRLRVLLLRKKGLPLHMIGKELGIPHSGAAYVLRNFNRNGLERLLIKEKSFLPFLPSTKPEFSRPKLKAGLLTLNELWEEGYDPLTVRHHHHLTWFALKNANIRESSKVIGWSAQNFLTVYFRKYLVYTSPHQWRRILKDLHDRSPGASFPVLLDLFLKAAHVRIRFTEAQNKRLIELWKTGFPYRMLRPSFLLWASRTGQSPRFVIKRLALQHHLSYLEIFPRLTKLQPDLARWFAPLKPTSKDWQPSSFKDG